MVNIRSSAASRLNLLPLHYIVVVIVDCVISETSPNLDNPSQFQIPPFCFIWFKSVLRKFSRFALKIVFYDNDRLLSQNVGGGLGRKK